MIRTWQTTQRSSEDVRTKGERAPSVELGKDCSTRNVLNSLDSKTFFDISLVSQYPTMNYEQMDELQTQVRAGWPDLLGSISGSRV